ncbi:MAG: ABC transporter substrate-binding protein [Anaerolineae bacterium]|nr:ABC transporter substrate-binding protein [Anaerolineae bacterium]
MTTRNWKNWLMVLLVFMLATACQSASTPEPEGEVVEPAVVETEEPAEAEVVEEATAEAMAEEAAATEEAAPSEEASGDPIKIVYVGDFSDVYSFYDLPVRNGAQFAVEEINAAGGVLGRPLELMTSDGKNDQALSLQLLEEALSGGDVAYIIGTTGDAFLAQATVACGQGIPISTGDGTAPTLVGDAGDCAFQLVMSDTIQGALAAQYAYQQGYRTAFTIRSTEIPYTDNMIDYFTESFEHLGGKVIGEEQYRIDAGDYSALATSIAGLPEAPDVLFTAMFIPDTPIFVRQLRSAGVETPLISTDGNHDASLLDAGEAVEGMVFTTHAFPSADNALGKFFALYEESTGTAPDSVAYGVGYDEIYMVKQAIESTGSAEPADIMEGLKQISGFEGVTGTITMNPDTRRSDKAVTLVKVENGELVFLDQVLPDYIPEP